MIKLSNLNVLEMSLTAEKREPTNGSISKSIDEEVSRNSDQKNVTNPCDQEKDAAEEQNKDGEEQNKDENEPKNVEASREMNKKKIRLEETPVVSTSNSDETLSKNQRKRLIKQQKYIEIQKLRKIQKKEKQREKQRLKREQREAEGEKVEEMSNEHSVKKYTNMDSEDALSLKVAIDLSFDDLMSPKDIKKLMKQVQRCYALNRRSKHPLQLYFTSFGGKSKQRLDDLCGHYVSWDVHIKTDDLAEVFPKEDIVYLTSDSPNVLEEIDMSKTYVIGGFVDHNHHKGLCYNMANEKRLGHAKLPIGEFMKLSTRTVLTVNQVFEIILFYTESKDWVDAFNKVMPQRKITPKVKRRGKNGEAEGKQENKAETKTGDCLKEVDTLD